MKDNSPSDIVRSIPGRKPEMAHVWDRRAAAIANRGPTPDEIRLRAFQIYEAGGRVAGRDVRDWLQAERELRRER